MDKFEYIVLTSREQPNGPVLWTLNGPQGPQDVGPNLPQVLNQLGSQGWEVAALGDVVGGSRDEIILKRRVR